MKNKIFLLLNLIVILFIFLFGNSMTTTPGHSSGNGNPAILLLFPLLILFIILIVQWKTLFRKWVVSQTKKITVLVIIFSHFIVGVYYQSVSHGKYREFLAEVYQDQFGSIDWEYINSITSGFSIHINNQFFNLNTYFLFVNLSIFIWMMSNLIRNLIKPKKDY